MSTLVQLIEAELLKLRRSPALRLMWVMPCLFLLLDFILSGRFALGLKELSPGARAALLNAPVKSLADYWSGYFHPMLIALLPALLFRPEHRYGVWKHLHVQPVSRRLLYLVKALVLALTFGLVLALTEVLLWAQWGLLGRLSPMAAFPFPWLKVSLIMGWSFLGSLPLLALYLWLSDRINNAAVPVMLGLVGFILTVSMGGKELDPMWRRDFIPWVLPYTCAQQAIEDPSARQEIHAAQTPYYKAAKSEVPKEVMVGKTRWVFQLPEEFGRPTPPTPKWALATFSLVCGVAFLLLGLVEAGRDRA